MNRISVNVLFALVFLSLLSPFIYTVEAVACTGATTCTNSAIHDVSEECLSLQTTICMCAAKHTNDGSGDCVEGSVCTGAACSGTLHDPSGLCTADDSTLCKCAVGNTNNTADGTCVEVCLGSNSPLMCDAATPGVNSSTCTPNKGCDCSSSYGNVADGTCVAGEDCTTPANCTGPGHTGTCAANGTDCICKLGYTDGGA
eukprot:Lankesteria_metandrocarpae@DN5434_c0_g3_i1.p1